MNHAVAFSCMLAGVACAASNTYAAPFIASGTEPDGTHWKFVFERTLRHVKIENTVYTQRLIIDTDAFWNQSSIDSWSIHTRIRGHPDVFAPPAPHYSVQMIDVPGINLSLTEHRIFDAGTSVTTTTVTVTGTIPEHHDTYLTHGFVIPPTHPHQVHPFFYADLNLWGSSPIPEPALVTLPLIASVMLVRRR